MTAYKLSAVVADPRLAHALADAMQESLAPAPEALALFEERDGASPRWRIDAYFPAPPDASSLHRELESFLGRAVPALDCCLVPDLNWVAVSQAALPPVSAGRFTVHGSHDRRRVPRGPNAIEIDANEAFGTARHATTLGCLVAIDRLARQRAMARALDLGCGSGILAIAAASAWPGAKVVATDADPISVAVARANALANGVRNRMTLIRAEGVDAPCLRPPAIFDVIAANLLAAPLIGLAPGLRRISAPRGSLVLAGVLTGEARTVIAAYRARGFALESHLRIDGWSTLTFKNRAAVPRRKPHPRRVRRRRSIAAARQGA